MQDLVPVRGVYDSYADMVADESPLNAIVDWRIVEVEFHETDPAVDRGGNLSEFIVFLDDVLDKDFILTGHYVPSM
jgi:hypothetical protein